MSAVMVRPMGAPSIGAALAVMTVGMVDYLGQLAERIA